jgi:hypothetical protein
VPRKQAEAKKQHEEATKQPSEAKKAKKTRRNTTRRRADSRRSSYQADFATEPAWRVARSALNAAPGPLGDTRKGGLGLFWRFQWKRLPHWTDLARLSAMVERVFSWMKYSWGNKKGHALESTLRTSLYLKFNDGITAKLSAERQFRSRCRQSSAA